MELFGLAALVELGGLQLTIGAPAFVLSCTTSTKIEPSEVEASTKTGAAVVEARGREALLLSPPVPSPFTCTPPPALATTVLGTTVAPKLAVCWGGGTIGLGESSSQSSSWECWLLLACLSRMAKFLLLSGFDGAEVVAVVLAVVVYTELSGFSLETPLNVAFRSFGRFCLLVLARRSALLFLDLL